MTVETLAALPATAPRGHRQDLRQCLYDAVGADSVARYCWRLFRKQEVERRGVRPQAEHGNKIDSLQRLTRPVDYSKINVPNF